MSDDRQQKRKSDVCRLPYAHTGYWSNLKTKPSASTASTLKASDARGTSISAISNPAGSTRAVSRRNEARREANLLADHLRRHGPFEPHRLPLEEMEYSTLPQVMKKLDGRWEKS